MVTIAELVRSDARLVEPDPHAACNAQLETMTARMKEAARQLDSEKQGAALLRGQLETSERQHATHLARIGELEAQVANLLSERAQLERDLLSETSAKEAANLARESEAAARLEAEHRVTVMAGEIRKPIPPPPSVTFPATPPPVEYVLEVAARDSNDRIKSIRLRPVEKK